jgi:hypothetical protein
MADPVLDEAHIIQLLRAPATVEMINILQAGAVQALMDLYDRKVTRDDFAAMASPCIALYSQTAKLWLLHNIQDVFDGGDLTHERFVVASEGLSEIIRKWAEVVIEQVKRLQMCPGDKDVVH